MDGGFIIPLNGLTAGENRFFWQAGKEFFDGFENSEILDAGLQVETDVQKCGRHVDVECRVTGKVTVECDRCLDELDMAVDVVIPFSIRYGNEDSPLPMQSDEREVVFVQETDAEFDMSQIIYDYVCLSLPMQRTHEAGGCNPDAMRFYAEPENSEIDGEDGAESPFAALKGLFR